MTGRYIIVGNPNTGKTTLFNKLTNSHEKIANYSGVTTGVKSKVVEVKDKKIEFVDLPGLYSFESLSEDELVTKRYLEEHKNENVIFVCASNKIKKNLVLIDELKKYNEKLVVVINKFKNGLDDSVVESLEGELGVPVIQVDVRKGVDEVVDLLAGQAAGFLNNNFKLDKIFDMLPTNPSVLKSLDKILLNDFWGKLIFVGIFIAIIFISYGKVGGGVTAFLDCQIKTWGGEISVLLAKLGVAPIADFWDRVILGGLGSVVVFLPQLAIMLSLLFILEDMGYLPRVGNLFNYSLERVGMNGKSVFSLIMGVGCTTSAILTSRNVGSKEQRMATVRFLPFIGCSAKIPVVLFLSGAIITGSGSMYVLLSYLTVAIIGLTILYVSKNERSEDYFISELPTLTKPSVFMSIKEAIKIVFDLFKKIFLTVFVSSTIFWLLLNITPDFKFFSGEKSLIEYASEFVAILLKPIGLGEPVVVMSLLTGLLAKENVLSTLGMFGGISGFSPNQIVSFMIFVLCYSPCLPALKCASCEFGKKYAGVWLLVQTVIAYIASMVYWTFSNIWMPLGFIMLILFSIFAYLIKKYNSISKNKRKVNASA